MREYRLPLLFDYRFLSGNQRRGQPGAECLIMLDMIGVTRINVSGAKVGFEGDNKRGWKRK